MRGGARHLGLLVALCFAIVSAGCGRIGFDLLASSNDSGAGGSSGEGGSSGNAGQGGSSGNAGGGGSSGNAGGSGTSGSSGGGGDTEMDGGLDGSTDDGGVDGPPDGGVICVLGVCSSDIDRCPLDPDKMAPGICGCGVSDDADEDGDLTPDCIDRCPGEPDRLPDGTCGCAAAAADDDGDGEPNCLDWCPSDPDKVEPEFCGCGMPEDDDDGDGMPTCSDGCHEDPLKVLPGVCGCGVVEDDLDTDLDGEPDCIDVCNGVDDASYVPVDSCGIGYCRDTNTASTCVAGLETACMPGAPLSALDATCDGVDDDCDTTADEDYASTMSTCGVGACAATGVVSCVAGSVSDSCAPRAPAPSDATCNGVDDDCDTTADEDFTPFSSTCGVGACAATGTVTCVGGAPVDSCTPTAPASNDATCDDVDDDCDGDADEDYGPSSTTCGAGACVRGGELRCIGGEEIDSCVAGTGADDDDSCNGVDDDCDGTADEDYAVTPTACGLGVCAATGELRCVNGAPANSCATGAPTGADDDCDGVDQDCDGVADEHYVVTATSCGVGACGRTGALTCVNGTEMDSCMPGAPAPDDATCDGIDQDCSNGPDDDYVPTPTSCGVGACARAGLLICVSGSTSDTCVAGAPTADDDCDGVDDDCDGEIDEHYVPVATSCGVGACGRAGLLICVNGSTSDTCAAGAPVADNDCDGVDDDCDTRADEHYVVTATSCGVGACVASGQLICTGGMEIDTCVDGSAAVDNDCDGVDDDCDGDVDEHYVPTATSCGVGACGATGMLTCVAGSPVDTCTPGTPAPDDATCDGIDQDCSDGPDDDYVPTPTSCGVGACARTGQMICASGSVSDTCMAGSPTADDDCDGVDDDCDGNIDEHYAPVVTSCGVGACGRTGVTSCVSGSVQDSCSPGSPTPDTSCDGVDNDCDTRTDEHYAPVATSCGVGACGRTGVTSCVSGSVQDSCTPGTPTPDASCNGVDNDCDGAFDEHYAPVATSCGVGACARTGVTSCVSGSVQDSCSPGAPTADNNCNGVDNDCDGAIDEHYAPVATSCGVGACARTGVTSCVSGSVQNSCTPGSPTADNNCNGVDNDCDSRTDEHYVPTATSCGVGMCAATGQNVCSMGSVVNTCMPGTPRPGPDDPSWPGNGQDNDCDGTVDEDSVPPCNVPDSVYSTTGLHNITVPAGCSSATVRLWGAGGASGGSGGFWGGGVTAGTGGAGGYALRTFTVNASSVIQLRIGQGGQCSAGGANNTTYNGGNGGTSGAQAGVRGNDGVNPAGGSGGTASQGGNGGVGYFGGGGGGAGRTFWAPVGVGGGGGAASVFILNPGTGQQRLVAGGGGGGGGVGSNIATQGRSAGNGGTGCSGNAPNSPTAEGGGGGGGGKCDGTTNNGGSGRNPHVPTGYSLSGGAAAGGNNAQDACAVGGNGYAIIDWAP